MNHEARENCSFCVTGDHWECTDRGPVVVQHKWEATLLKEIFQQEEIDHISQCCCRAILTEEPLPPPPLGHTRKTLGGLREIWTGRTWKRVRPRVKTGVQFKDCHKVWPP